MSRALRAELESLFRSALAAVDAGAAVRRAVARDGPALVLAGDPVPAGAPLVVLAAGKAAAAMAAALEDRAGDRIADGLCITKEGHGLPLRHLVLRETAHPVPDERSRRAAEEALALVERAPPEAVLVVLLSGGASSLMSAPAPGLCADDVADTIRELLRAGADIEALNAVRKHLSAVGGGRLARRARSRRVEVLAISDVPGDRPDVIGSGPFCADPTRYADALDVLDDLGLRQRVPAAVRAYLEAGARGEHPETPKAGDPSLAGVHTALLATNRSAVDAVLAAARGRGLRALRGGSLAGEAREAGRRIGALARALRPEAPTCWVAGGETTVTVRGRGRGGRSQELALAAAFALEGTRDLALLAAGTDGTDGPTDAAGAHADGGTLARGRARGADPAAALADNDSYGFFQAEGGLLRTGPTHTNVMDLVLLRADPQAAADRERL